MKKFKEWDTKLQAAAKTMAAILFFSPILLGVFRAVKPKVEFVNNGAEIRDSLYNEVSSDIDSLEIQVKELREALFVVAGALADNMPYVDSCTYYIKEGEEKIKGRIKRALSGDLYIFIPDRIVGERPYLIGRHLDKGLYHFFDFSGKMIPVYKEE